MQINSVSSIARVGQPRRLRYFGEGPVKTLSERRMRSGDKAEEGARPLQRFAKGPWAVPSLKVCGCPKQANALNHREQELTQARQAYRMLETAYSHRKQMLICTSASSLGLRRSLRHNDGTEVTCI